MDRGVSLAAVVAISACFGVLAGCSTNSETGATGDGGTTAAGGSGGGGGSAAAGGSTGAAGSVTATGGVTGEAGATAPGGAGGTGGTGGTVGSSAGGSTSAGGATATAGTGGRGGTSGAAGSAAAGSGGHAAGSGGSSASAGTTGGGLAGAGGATGGAAGSSSMGGSGGAGTAVVKKYIGNISPKNMDIPTDFADLWMQVSMEANSKWGYVQANSATDWDWAPVDAVYSYAMDHNLIFKQHNFFWNFEQPSWVTSSNVATAGPAWVQAFCMRYPGTVMIDVINEPMHNPAPYASGMGGAGKSGWDWVVQGYQWARQYCPNAILILNEFNIIEYDADNANYISMLQKVLAAGGQVDAIGAQGHDVYKIGAAKAKTYLDKLASTFNLPIYITELDIDQSNDSQQQQLMMDEITMFWNHPSVPGITYWGYMKGLTWRTNAWLLDTSSGKWRPAGTWLLDFIQSNR